MIKKIVTLSLLTSSLLYAELEQKGPFISVDISLPIDSYIEYEPNTEAGYFTISKYEAKIDDNTYSYKLGYQYYFTRFYFRYANNSFEDKDKNKFKADITTYEVDAEYIPVFYRSSSDTWMIRGLFGFGVGYHYSELTDYTNPEYEFFFPKDTDLEEQHYMEYGYQVGLLLDTSWGIQLETGYRYRVGDLQEYKEENTNNEVSFDLDTSEIYFGLGYMF